MLAALSPRGISHALGRTHAALLRIPRRLIRASAAPLLGRVLYRLCLGAWPSRPELQLFNQGLRDGQTPLPPCCRAMLNVPAARVQISRVVLLDMVRSGAIIPGDPFDHPVAAAGPATLPPQSGNPLSFWHGPPVAFLHLEKTGGVSLAKLLTDMFHPHQIDPDPRRTLAPHVAPPFAGRSLDGIRRHPLVFGHYDLPSLQRLDPNRTLVTMLRNPVERILSLYYYWRSIDLGAVPVSASHAAVRTAHRCGLLEFLETDDPAVRNHIDNLYVRRLTGGYATGARPDPVRQAPEAGLSAALAGLGQFDFVGITEQMGASVSALGDLLGFQPPDTIPQENVTAANMASGGVFRAVPRETLTPAHWRQLGRLTRLDAVIYRVATDRFEVHRGYGARTRHSRDSVLDRAG